jgi:single-strand DNA-binding protein
MEIIGKLEAIFDTQIVSEKFTKREFVIKTEESTPYPQFISVQVTQDKCQILDQYQIGDDVKIQINIKGRMWNGPQGVKYFNTLEAWKIELVNKAMPSNMAAANTQSNSGQSSLDADVNNSVNTNEDLPF